MTDKKTDYKTGYLSCPKSVKFLSDLKYFLKTRK